MLSVSVEQVVAKVIAGLAFWEVVHLEGSEFLLRDELQCLCVDGQSGSLPCLPAIYVITLLIILLPIFALIAFPICCFILLPDVLDLIERALEQKGRRIHTHFRRDSSYCPFEVDQLLHKQRHIQLLLYLLLALSEHRHFPPVPAADEPIEDAVEQIPQIVDEVELVCADLLLVVVAIQPAAEAELVAELVVGVKDEDESEDSADESSDIGQKSVQFLVGARVACVGA